MVRPSRALGHPSPFTRRACRAGALGPAGRPRSRPRASAPRPAARAPLLTPATCVRHRTTILTRSPSWSRSATPPVSGTGQSTKSVPSASRAPRASARGSTLTTLSASTNACVREQRGGAGGRRPGAPFPGRPLHCRVAPALAGPDAGIASPRRVPRPATALTRPAARRLRPSSGTRSSKALSSTGSRLAHSRAGPGAGASTQAAGPSPPCRATPCSASGDPPEWRGRHASLRPLPALPLACDLGAMPRLVKAGHEPRASARDHIFSADETVVRRYRLRRPLAAPAPVRNR